MTVNNHPSRLFRYLAIHGLMGAAVALACGLLLLATDAGGIGGLILASYDPATGVIIFLAAAVTTIVPVVIATAIGMLAYEDDAS